MSKLCEQSPASTPESRRPEGSDSAQDALLNAWDRLLAVAVLYPADNDRFLAMVEEWRQALDGLEGGQTIDIEVGADYRLAHCGRIHEPGRVERSRLYPLLLHIGIEGVRLSRDVQAGVLHRFITMLRETAQAAERGLGLKRPELPELPAGVELRLRSFADAREERDQTREADSDPFSMGRREPSDARLEEQAAAGGEESADSVESSRREAGDGDREESIAAGAENSVERTDEALAEFPEESSSDQGLANPHLGAKTDLDRSFEEMLTASATVLHRDLVRKAQEAAERDSLENPEQEAVLDSADEHDKRPAPRPEAPPEFVPEMLHSCFDEEDGGFASGGADDGEWLAILIQFFREERETVDVEVLEREISSALSGELNLQEEQILLSALEELLATGDVARVDRLLPRLLSLLRKQGDLEARLLMELMSGAGMTGQELLWPHLADTVLGGAPELLARIRKDGRNPVLYLPPELRERVLPRFESCPALLAGRLDPAMFRPWHRALASLYIMLLRSVHADAAGNLLCQALREQPPAEPYASLLVLQDAYRSRHRKFYLLLMQVEEQPTLGDDLAREAAEQARSELTRIRGKERRRPEVLKAISLLTAAPPGPTDELLSEIRSRRRFAFLRVWPAAARRAAKRVVDKRARNKREGGAS